MNAVARSTTPSDITLPALLRARSETHGDRRFLRFIGGREETFSEFTQRCLALAEGLRRAGVTQHDTVALLMGNRLEFVESWFAASVLGAIEVPVNTELRGPLLQHVMRDHRAQVLIAEAELVPHLDASDAWGRITTLVVVGGQKVAAPPGVRVVAYTEMFSQPGDWGDTPRLDGSDPISIMYTSGTTGPSKGVVSSHQQYFTWARNLAANMDLTADDSYYHCLPLSYGDAQFFAVYFALMHGTSATFSSRFSASNYWSEVIESGATATNLLGAMAHILWKQEPRDMDAANPLRICNAIPMPSFKDGFERRFGLDLVTGYGQTETNMVAYSTVQDWRPGSCGRAAPDYEIAVVDENDDTVPPGTVGELVVRGRQPNSLMTKYWNLPAATATVMRNGWFHTGDAGWLDDDGWLYFDHRIKDAIRRRGQNISAEEVEGVVIHHPAVRDAAAVAVPSDLSEDEVKIVVSIRPNASLTPEDLLDYCAPRLARFMIPRYVEIRTASLPTTASQKIAKAELRAEGIGPATWDRDAAGYTLPR